MNLKKEKYTYTPEEIDKLVNKIVKELSRKKFTENDIIRIIDDIPKKRVNRRTTGYNLFMGEYREDKQGEKQSEIFKKGGKDWKELSEREKNRYINEAEEKKKELDGEKEEKEEKEKESEYEGYKKYELKCKNKCKLWMYKKELEQNNLIMCSGILGSKIKKENKIFLDDDQLECYLNKQIELRRTKGYIEM